MEKEARKGIPKEEILGRGDRGKTGPAVAGVASGDGGKAAAAVAALEGVLLGIADTGGNDARGKTKQANKKKKIKAEGTH